MEAYLLTCECGSRHQIEPRQAGQRIDCGCGQPIEVPTLRAMRQLPRVESSTEDTSVGWSRAQGALFVAGMVVTLISLTVMTYLLFLRAQINVKPIRVEQLEFFHDVMQLTPEQSWDAWVSAFRDTKLGTRVKQPVHLINRELARKFLWGAIAAGTCLAMGLVTTVVSFFMGPRR